MHPALYRVNIIPILFQKILQMKTRIILVEGVSGTGKTTLIKGLIQKNVNENEKTGTFLCLSQSHTYFPVNSEENSYYASVQENADHLQNILGLLDWSISFGKTQELFKLYCIIDTLHITHCFHPGNMKWNDVEEFDKRLAKINCKLLFLRANAETILHRGLR
jgi:GTPase SAR1 family protein